MRWPWRKQPKPDIEQATEARRRAEDDLRSIRAMTPAVEQAAAGLRHRVREVNHLAEAIRHALGGA